MATTRRTTTEVSFDCAFPGGVTLLLDGSTCPSATVVVLPSSRSVSVVRRGAPVDSLDAGQLRVHLDETDRMCHIWQCDRRGTIKRGELYDSISRKRSRESIRCKRASAQCAWMAARGASLCVITLSSLIQALAGSVF